jgi:predicted GIY-YIG superfamily endonuclease
MACRHFLELITLPKPFTPICCRHLNICTRNQPSKDSESHQKCGNDGNLHCCGSDLSALNPSRFDDAKTVRRHRELQPLQVSLLSFFHHFARHKDAIIARKKWKRRERRRKWKLIHNENWRSPSLEAQKCCFNPIPSKEIKRIEVLFTPGESALRRETVKRINISPPNRHWVQKFSQFPEPITASSKETTSAHATSQSSPSISSGESASSARELWINNENAGAPCLDINSPWWKNNSAELNHQKNERRNFPPSLTLVLPSNVWGGGEKFWGMFPSLVPEPLWMKFSLRDSFSLLEFP